MTNIFIDNKLADFSDNYKNKYVEFMFPYYFLEELLKLNE